jgi:hypothetical protein
MFKIPSKEQFNLNSGNIFIIFKECSSMFAEMLR